MGAELLAPLAKWGALVLLAVGLCIAAVRMIRSGAVARDDRKEAQQALKLQMRAEQAAERERKRVDDL